MEKEIWKDIPGYEGLYQVSTLGNVRSLKFNKIKELKQTLHSTGYLQVGLYKNGKGEKFKIHQLIAITFLEHTPCGHELEIDHVNTNPIDNRLKNLRILTHRKNCSKERTKKSGLPVGVCKHQNKYRTLIYINGKQKHLGLFNTPEEASEAYQQALKNLNKKA